MSVQAPEAASLSRREDAHRKIKLGGLIIAAGADHLDPAEVVGTMLVWLHNRDDDKAARVRERGIRHLEEREAARSKV